MKSYTIKIWNLEIASSKKKKEKKGTMADLSMTTHLAEGAVANMSMDDIPNFDGVRFHTYEKVNDKNKALTILISLAAIGSIVSALAAMYLEASLITYIAFAFPLLIAPYVIHQRRKIQWIPSKYHCWEPHVSIWRFSVSRRDGKNVLEESIREIMTGYSSFSRSNSHLLLPSHLYTQPLSRNTIK